ncbi:MAG TPA: hypothetical protein VK671_01670 [Mucilaginibacter sp.]|nr:hypothetical protein [Mucilaginibacter sp.]
MAGNAKIMKSFIFYLLIGILVSFSPNHKNDQGYRLFNAIYESQKRYFEDSLDSYSFFKQIVDFGRKYRQKFYEAHNININKPKTYIIFEGNSNIGALYTGIVFEEDKEIAYVRTPAKGWQVATFKKSEFDSLSKFTYIGVTMINKVSTWDTVYINRQIHSIGGTCTGPQ